MKYKKIGWASTGLTWSRHIHANVRLLSGGVRAVAAEAPGVRPFYASILVQIQQLIHEKETPQLEDGELKRPRSLFGPYAWSARGCVSFLSELINYLCGS